MKISLWRALEHGLDNDTNMSAHKNYAGGFRHISESRLGVTIPEMHLWIAVLIDAAKYRDHDFLNAHLKKICSIARLDAKSVSNAFKYLWELEDNAHNKK